MTFMTDADANETVVNVNVGVLGHVDSGKTRLVRALSQTLSTAALDKAPQSQQRGVTLDLGFSALRLSPSLQVTLVDCPGHAALFKTILGGVAIVDLALLVVDALKGLQPQTVESLVVAALAVGGRVVVALSKTDLLPGDDRDKQEDIDKTTEEIRAFLRRYLPGFTAGREVNVDAIPIVPVGNPPDSTNDEEAVEGLVDALRQTLQQPTRDATGPFSLAVDHCFAIPGNGTVLTGTVLSGKVAVGQEIELPDLAVVKKVKGIQSFKQPVQTCRQGDRVGIRVNGLDASTVERGIAIAPGSMSRISQVVIDVQAVPFFQSISKSGGKFHTTIGHTTVIAVATFFSKLGSRNAGESVGNQQFDPVSLYEYVESTSAEVQSPPDPIEANREAGRKLFALLQFEQDVFCPPNALVVCSRLDLDPKKYHCRLAFYGHVQAVVALSEKQAVPNMVSILLSDLIVGRVKSRGGVVDKVVATRGQLASVREVIGREMFGKDVDWAVYSGVSVMFETSRALGRIVGPFGTAGKFRIELLSSPPPTKTPVSGEKFVLRFLKHVSIKPPKQKGKGASSDSKSATKAAASTATGSTGGQARTKARGSGLLQDEASLYPEAFIPTTSVDPPADTVPEELTKIKLDPSITSSTSTTSSTTEDQGATKHVRTGVIERLKGETTANGRNPVVIVKDMFEALEEAEAAVKRQVAVGKPGQTEYAEVGEIEKPFGKAGKVRIVFLGNGGTSAQVGDAVVLI